MSGIRDLYPRRKTTGKTFTVLGGWFEVELVCGHKASVPGWQGSFKIPKTVTCTRCPQKERRSP